MSIDQIAPEALRLPARERALLAASLWESVEDPYALAADRSDEDALVLALARQREPPRALRSRSLARAGSTPTGSVASIRRISTSNSRSRGGSSAMSASCWPSRPRRWPWISLARPASSATRRTSARRGGARMPTSCAGVTSTALRRSRPSRSWSGRARRARGSNVSPRARPSGCRPRSMLAGTSVRTTS